MEIGTMSAEELANSFQGQTQNQNQDKQPTTEQPKVGDNFKSFQELATSKTADEIAQEFKDGTQKPTEDNSTAKTPEQIEAEKVAGEVEAKKPSTSQKTKMDDTFKSGLDKLFKEQKLNPYSDGTETGYIVPETYEDLYELLEENKKSWIESSKAKDREELISEVLATKSPAWQFLIQNSDLYKDPADLIPLLNSVQNQEYSNSLDPKNEGDQEKIVRAALSIQGLSPQDIEDEIADLKDREILAKRSESLKPVLDKYNEQVTTSVLEEKVLENQKNEEFWNNHYQNLENTVFKSKDLDGVKLKNEHKQLIASTLIPDKKIGGLPIYTIIDNLIAEGKFVTLSKIALLGLDEKLYDNYFLSAKADKKAEGIQKVLRQSGTNSTSSEVDEDTKIKTIKKSNYGYFG